MNVEKETQATRVKPEDLDAAIESIWYMNVGDCMKADDYQPPVGTNNPLRLVTICALILRNGHKVIGVNYGPVVAADFNAEQGKKLALDNAKEQLWPLLGYALREKLNSK